MLNPRRAKFSRVLAQTSPIGRENRRTGNAVATSNLTQSHNHSWLCSYASFCSGHVEFTVTFDQISCNCQLRPRKEVYPSPLQNTRRFHWYFLRTVVDMAFDELRRCFHQRQMCFYDENASENVILIDGHETHKTPTQVTIPKQRISIASDVSQGLWS